MANTDLVPSELIYDETHDPNLTLDKSDIGQSKNMGDDIEAIEADNQEVATDLLEQTQANEVDIP